MTQETSNDQPASDRRIRLDSLRQRRAHDFTVILTRDEMETAAGRLGLVALDKARLTCTLRPSGQHDWDLDGQIGATVTQACVVTLAPVRTRIDEPLTRRFREDYVEPDIEEDSEIEMPEDDTLEPLPAALDFLSLFEESLSLALPPYPRAEGAEIVEQSFAEPGVKPLTDEDTKPFAGLAGLRDKLKGDEN
ncbi:MULTISPECIES: YceD family protein [unclassified Meridianimarinicoccus]|uniref:YceD family protein n=1 Tax=unclassified Meridianimarinicoccus TaxID=2923344 RepID=UPI001D01FF39|nr:DUF177 domain-containing protein [Fluviibacterium sp. MJW13]